MSFQQHYQANQPFQTLFNAAPITIVITDAVGQIVMVNHHAELMFGYAESELLGHTIEMLLPTRFRESHVKYRTTYSEAPRKRAMGVGLDLFGMRYDGTEFPIEVGLSTFSFEGQTYTTAMVTDITRRKQLENEIHLAELMEIEISKEREIIELKERFISVASHELRNPLTTILTSAGMLEHFWEIMPFESKMKHINRILQHAQEMTNMLNEVLSLSRARAGTINLQPEATNLYEFCWQIYEEHIAIDDGNHRFHFSCPEVQDVKLDQRVLRHVLFNLLSNASKYSPTGTEIRFQVHQENENHVFCIQDEGIGIPAEEIDRIFEPFHRAKNATDISGTGLGLAIVRHNVEAHGGTITCLSEINRGTTFTVRLPIRP